MIGRPEKLAATVMMLGTLLAAPPTLRAGPGAAGRGPRPSRPVADYLVLIWYRADDPLGTFRYRSYDARKGEYTPAVDDWVRLMRQRFARYEVRVLPVSLAREKGGTDKLKVGSVIRRELLLAAARSGVVLGAPLSVGPAPRGDGLPSVRTDPRPSRTPGAGGSTNINPVTPPMPFPMPYTRPHP
jgi:hypothetical protein